MNILVVSDSHLFGNDLQRITKLYKNKVDLMIHCGDSSLTLDDPLIHQDICVTHGHHYNVYYGYDDLVKLCQSHHCHLCLHGHTHVPTHQIHQGIHFINPGSLMMNRGSYGYGTYALVNYENNHTQVTYYHHQTDQPVDECILKEGLKLLDEFKKLLK